ncbi:MAG: hypothetical protein WA154_13000 [Moraxellaceae bacterium]
MKTAEDSTIKGPLGGSAESVLAAGPEPKEEFGSFTITIDHLVRDDRDDGHTVTKVIMSTESAVESLLSQFRYFKDTVLLETSEVRKMVSVGEDQPVVYIYTPNDNQTNIIVDGPVWDDTLKHPALGGTVLSAVSSFITLGVDMVRAAKAEGQPAGLLVFVPDAK